MRRSESMQQSSATPKNQDVGIGLRKIVACSHSSSQCLLVSTVFGTVSSLHPTSFLMIFILVSLIFCPGLASTVARGEITRATRIAYTYAHAYCAGRRRRRRRRRRWRKSRFGRFPYIPIAMISSYFMGVFR